MIFLYHFESQNLVGMRLYATYAAAETLPEIPADACTMNWEHAANANIITTISNPKGRTIWDGSAQMPSEPTHTTGSIAQMSSSEFGEIYGCCCATTYFGLSMKSLLTDAYDAIWEVLRNQNTREKAATALVRRSPWFKKLSCNLETLPFALQSQRGKD